ncbi:hypothetical protein WBZ18_00515 [Clostridium botulinum]|uniref:hypothetical protein n=1 Tax=Clostridium botulinum TaxID=1491 RepID=UPI00339D7DB2
MLNEYVYVYDFDNFSDFYDYKLKFRNGTKFKFLDNYYEYYFSPKSEEGYGEQTLYCYCWLKKENETEALNKIRFSNKVLEYLTCIPIHDEKDCIRNDIVDENYISNKFKNISHTKVIKKLEHVSAYISRFKVERDLFEDVIRLNEIAFKNLLNAESYWEDSLFYSFKVIEKIAKKNYIKFHERKYTKKVKKDNKKQLRNFIAKYFKESFGITMTENMLNTSVDEIYKKMREEAYDSIFLKISFFCNIKKLSVDLDEVAKLVKVRNKLAHGDFVAQDKLGHLVGMAFNLSRQFISLYFFDKTYEDINIKCHIKVN